MDNGARGALLRTYAAYIPPHYYSYGVRSTGVPPSEYPTYVVK
jgi:hypothetical protein